MADIDTVSNAIAAQAMGADLMATSLYGYTITKDLTGCKREVPTLSIAV